MVRNYGLFHMYCLSSPSKMQTAREQRLFWGSSDENACYVLGVSNGGLVVKNLPASAGDMV